VTTTRPPALTPEYRLRWRRSRWPHDRLSETVSGSKPTVVSMAKQLLEVDHGDEGRVVRVAIEQRLVSAWATTWITDELDATSKSDGQRIPQHPFAYPPAADPPAHVNAHDAADEGTAVADAVDGRD
jgi:hypothetical protein